VIAPAFSAGKGFYEWNAAKLATHGFIALNIDTITPNDWPGARADQMLAALDYLVNTSSIKDRVDGSRLAVEGHSASAVGVLMAGLQRPSLKAVIALAPVGDHDLSGMKVPTLLVCADADAANPAHCNKLAGGMPAGTPKKVVPVKGGHGFPTGDNEAFPAELEWLQQHLGGGAREGSQSDPASGPASSPGATLHSTP
jgi:dienelactone hydrolase